MPVSINGNSGITFPNGTEVANILGNSTQTYQNLTASRVNGTTYTNTTGAPILVMPIGSDASGQGFALVITVGGVSFGSQGGSPAGNNIARPFIVPIGATYSISWNPLATFVAWWELR
tara:strand:+ start:300 stop:653 length:354 start_codon:yes stop_codon:yes gene_type:complete